MMRTLKVILIIQLFFFTKYLFADPPPRAKEHYLNAHEALQVKDINRAIEELKKAIELYPEYADAHNDLGDIYFKKGMLKEAVEEFSLAEKYQPDDPGIQKNLGIALYKTEQFEKAIEHLEKALSLSPSDFQLAYLLGMSYNKIKNYPAAKNALKKALELNPNDEKIANLLGTVCLKNSDIQDSILYFNKALEIKPDYISALFNLGNLYFYEGKYEQAVEYYEKGLNIESAKEGQKESQADKCLIIYNLAKSHLHLGNYGKAVKFLEMCQEITADFEDLYLDLAKAYQGLNDLPRAIGILQSGTTRHQKFINAKLMLAQLYLQEGNQEAGLSELNEILTLKPDHLVARKMLAQELIKTGSYQQAKEELMKVLEFKPEDTEAAMLLGDILQNQGDDEVAYKYYSIAVKDEKYKSKVEPILQRLGEKMITPVAEMSSPIKKEKEIAKKPKEPTKEAPIPTAIPPTEREVASLAPPKSETLMEEIKEKKSLPLSETLLQNRLENLKKLTIKYLNSKNFSLALIAVEEILKLEPDNLWAMERKKFIQDALDDIRAKLKAIQTSTTGLGSSTSFGSRKNTNYILISLGFGIVISLLLIYSTFQYSRSKRTLYSGDIEIFSLKEILQELEKRRLTGKLELKVGGEKGIVYIKDGKPVDAKFGDLKEDKALENMLLKRTGKIDFITCSIKKPNKIKQSINEFHKDLQ